MARNWLSVLLTVAVSAAAAAPNLLPNSSFEAGAAGWSLWHQNPKASSGGVTDEVARAGRRCFKVVNPGTGGANLHSDPIPAVGEADYTLSVYARTQGAKGVHIALWALDAGGKTLSHGLPHGASLPANQPAWARFKSVVRAPADCVALKAHLICNGGTVWWDAVKIEVGRDSSRYREGPPAGQAGKMPRNLLGNSGFEDGETDWSLWHQFPGRSSGGVVDGAGRNGGKAFHVANPGKGGANLHSAPLVSKPNTTYTISVYARVKGGVGVQLAGWAVDKTGKVNHYAVDGAVALPADVPGYRRFTKTFTTPPDAFFLKAHLTCNGGEVWWDDCQIEQGEKAADYASGPRVGPLPLREGPQAVAYTRAIVREARLRDVLAQAERLAQYAGEGKAKAARAALDDARTSVAQVSEAVGAPYLVPDYRSVDYGALDARIADAEVKLAAAWQALGHDPKGIFAAWQPRLEGTPDKKALADEFFIFPCFTGHYFFEGKGNWDLLKPFGFRIVSGWWGVGYTPEGELRPEGMDRIVRTCFEHGYRCDIAADGASAAAAALKGRLGEAVYLHNASGEWSPYGNCHNTVNIWHPEVQRAAADYLRKFAAHYASNPAVVSCELTNEPSLTIEKHEHGYHYTPIGVGGYSPPARKAFRAWLTKKHKTIEALNRLWRTRYKGFDEVEPPADLAPPAPIDGKTPVATGAILDFQAFRAESHADWFRLSVDAMHAGDPRKPVISQFIAAPFDRKEAAVDLRRMAEDVPWDIYGTHDWPGTRPAVNCLHAVSMNRKAGLPHWEDEFIWSQWERKGTPEPVMRAALERNLWRQVAWDKRGISLFNLESEWAHDQPGNWNNSMLNIEADLEVPRYSTGVIPTIERKANLFKDVLYQTRVAARDVAILLPTAATLASAPDHAARHEGRFLAARILEWHHLPLIVPEEHVISGFDGLRGRKLLIVPWAVHAPDALQARLLAWIEAGGVVLATGPLGLFDEYGTPSGRLLRAALGDLRWTFDAKAGRWRAVGPAGLRAGVERREVAASDAPLFVATLGKGRLYLWPDRIGTARRTDVLRSVVEQVVPAPFVQTELSEVEIIARSNALGEQFLFVVNLDARAARRGEILVRGRFDRVVDLACEARPRVPVSHLPGFTVVPLCLHAGGAVFLSLGKEDAAARVDDRAAAAALLRRHLQMLRKAVLDVQSLKAAGPGQAARRALLLAKLRTIERTLGPREAARYARRAKAIAALEPPKPVLEVARAARPVKIDGDLSEWAAGGWVAIEPTRVVLGERASDADLSARFQLAWDGAALYLACEVTDDKVVARQGDQELWKADCAEVFLDWLLDHPVSGPGYGPDDYQVFVTPAGGFAVSHPLPGRPRPEFVARAGSGGWVLEMALPWRQVGIEAPVAGLTFGFDLGIDDADASSDRRECQLMWHGRADNYRNTTRFAPVRLK